MKLFHSLGRQRETDQPTSMVGHEIDGVRRHVLGRHNEVTFILAIFVIDEDDKFPLLDVLDGIFDAMKRNRHNSNAACLIVTVQ
jgi:hypothetical protein